MITGICVDLQINFVLVKETQGCWNWNPDRFHWCLHFSDGWILEILMTFLGCWPISIKPLWPIFNYRLRIVCSWWDSMFGIHSKLFVAGAYWFPFIPEMPTPSTILLILFFPFFRPCRVLYSSTPSQVYRASRWISWTIRWIFEQLHNDVTPTS